MAFALARLSTEPDLITSNAKDNRRMDEIVSGDSSYPMQTSLVVPVGG